MREERVLLEEVPGGSSFRREVDTRLGIEPQRAVAGDAPSGGTKQARDDAEHRRLPGAGRADERHGGAVLDRQRDGGVEAAKGMGEVDVERHRVNTLTSRRVVALTITSRPLIARATSKSTSNCS